VLPLAIKFAQAFLDVQDEIMLGESVMRLVPREPACVQNVQEIQGRAGSQLGGDPRLGWTMQWVKGGDRELANDK